jgi:Tol biopolymer transport system component
VSRVIFWSRRKLDGTDAPNANFTSNIWRVNADGTSLAPLTDATAEGAGNGEPQWSPDGSKVVFSSFRKLDGTDAPNDNFTSNIWRANADGTGLTPLTSASAEGAGSSVPQWSPDGSKIVFISSRKLDGTDAPNANFTINIWRANADGTELTPLTNATANGAHSFGPKWSPDGSKVVFSSFRSLDGTDAPNANHTSNIWRLNADGTGLTPLTDDTARGARSGEPQWSPDGSKVLFSSSRKLDGTDASNANITSNIWRVNADGTGLMPLTNATGPWADSSGPQWSPDGSKVLFSSSRKLDGTDAPSANRTSNIWCVNADGTGSKPLTNATAPWADSSGPQWSPDGSKVVFISSRNLDGTDAPNASFTINIWRANADGTELTPLTNVTSTWTNSYSPSFSP